MSADACVFPSIREGLGLAAIEGMASGLPLIVADNRGTRDYVDDGKNGIVCRYDDVEGFAEAIESMECGKLKRPKVKKLNTEKMKTSFDMSIIKIKMREIYR